MSVRWQDPDRRPLPGTAAIVYRRDLTLMLVRTVDRYMVKHPDITLSETLLAFCEVVDFFKRFYSGGGSDA